MTDGRSILLPLFVYNRRISRPLQSALNVALKDSCGTITEDYSPFRGLCYRPGSKTGIASALSRGSRTWEPVGFPSELGRLYAGSMQRGLRTHSPGACWSDTGLTEMAVIAAELVFWDILDRFDGL